MKPIPENIRRLTDAFEARRRIHICEQLGQIVPRRAGDSICCDRPEHASSPICAPTTSHQVRS